MTDFRHGDGGGHDQHGGDDQQWAPEGTELQYYLEYGRAIQEQENYQRMSRGRYSTVEGHHFKDIPEGVEVTFDEGIMPPSSGERVADKAILSWNMGKEGTNQLGSQSSGLELSLKTASEIELKDFLKQRGERSLQGLHLAAAQGDRARIMNLMKQHGPAVAVDDLDSNGCSPLMYAVMADSIPTVEMLLNFSAKREQTDSAGRTAVHYAAFYGKHRSLKFLIVAAADWNPRDVYGRTPLHWTSANKSTKCLSVLLNHASIVMGDINPRDNEGMSPLHCAAQFGRHKHIALLNQADADFTAVDVEGRTPLHWTVTNPNTLSVLALTEAYPPLINKKDVYKNTVFHLAASNGATHILDTLLKMEGIEFDTTTDQGRTPLHLACINKHPETTQLLLSCGALDSLVDGEGFTALHYAVQMESVATLQAFAQMPDLSHLQDTEGKTPLMMAAEKSFMDGVDILTKSRAVLKSVNNIEINGRSALHLAAQSGSSECVTTLVSSGADPNLLDNFQQTPLFLATENSHGDCIKILVSSGCQPDLRDIEGQASIHKAVIYNQVESVQALVDCGADLDITDMSGSTPLHMAAYGGSSTAVSTLLDNGAHPNMQDTSGLTPMHYAAMEGNTECLAIFVTYKAHASIMDYSEKRYTPLDYATLNGYADCADILTLAGGMSTEGIWSMAAVSIQAAYRGYRARLYAVELKKKHEAVTILAKHIRGHLQRKRYQELKKKVHATIIIQAYTRGFLQRLKFKVHVSQYRAQRRHHQLMVEFGHAVARDHATSVLKTFPKEELDPSRDDLTGSQEVKGKDHKLRLETALRLRDYYLEKQKKWQEFREAEHKRRIEKAKRKELDRYASIVAKSKARRDYTVRKFHQTHTVHCYNEAAKTIQRAFRRMKTHRSLAEMQDIRERRQKHRVEDRAAKAIQRAWRKYQHYKLFRALNYKRVSTSAIITLKRQPTNMKVSKDIFSYQKDISITGNPRRKVHQTEQSGFKIFRPTTRELLFTPQSKDSSHNHHPTHSKASDVDMKLWLKEHSSVSKTVTAAVATLNINKKATTITGKKTLAEQRNPILNTPQTMHSKRDGLLPELSILRTSKKDYYKSSSKRGVHLPDIVGAHVSTEYSRV